MLVDCLAVPGIDTAIAERAGPSPSPSILIGGAEVMRPDPPPMGRFGPARPPRDAELVAARGVHDHGNAYQAGQGADHTPTVASQPVEGHAPRQRAGDEYAAVGGQDPAEMGIGLQGGDEPVHS